MAAKKKPELLLSGFLGLEAAVRIFLFRAGIGGSVNLSVGFDFNDIETPEVVLLRKAGPVEYQIEEILDAVDIESGRGRNGEELEFELTQRNGQLIPDSGRRDRLGEEASQSR